MSLVSLTRAQVHYIRQLKSKKYRFEVGSFLVEGRKSVGDLLQSNYETSLLVVTPEFLAENRMMFEGHDIPMYIVDSSMMARMSCLKTNHQVLAVAKIKGNDKLEVGLGERALVLDTIKDPGNLGTIIRIADWYGIKKIICSPTTVDRYNTKVIQASMGSFTAVEMYYSDLASFLSESKVPVIGTVVESPSYLGEVALPKQGMLVVGNESRGINPALREFFSLSVAIKGHGRADSLNVGVATGIICEWWCRT